VLAAPPQLAALFRAKRHNSDVAAWCNIMKADQALIRSHAVPAAETDYED
jgi:hypothetical protein